MTMPPDPTPQDAAAPGPDLPRLQAAPARRSRWRNVSLVWLVPLIAVVVSLGVAWRSYADRGTYITITFDDASGISPGETTNPLP